MNKSLVLSFVCLMFISVLISDVSAVNLDISFEQEPYPVHAGENVQLIFSVTNDGSENLSNIAFDLDTNDPVTLTSSSKKTISLDVGETKILRYDAFIESDASDGNEQITLNYDFNGSNYDEDFDVLIAPDQVYLQIESVTSLPEKAAPGENLSLSMRLRNTANSEIKNIILKLDLKDMPFAPESVTEKRINLIDENQIQDIQLNLIVLSSAQIQVYKIPLTLTYQDSYGGEYTRQDYISIEVFEKPSIDVLLDKNSLIQNMVSKIDFRILNKGLGKVTFVEAKILPSGDYSVEGSDSQYIGNIESDDYNSVEFKILPKKENFNILVELSYRDSNNQRYTETKTINVKAYSVQEAQRLGLLPAFPWFLIIIILVIIALIIFFIVRRNRKKKRLMLMKQQG